MGVCSGSYRSGADDTTGREPGSIVCQRMGGIERVDDYERSVAGLGRLPIQHGAEPGAAIVQGPTAAR